MCFTEHVTQLVSKGAKQINVLGRLSHKLSESCKQKILDAFIVSNFNYCSLTYHYCKMTDACKLERLFKRALRYVYLDFNSSYSDFLVKANKIPLYVQRIRLIHEAVYKIINNKYPPICPTFYERSNISNMYNLRNTNLLVQPRFNSIKFGYKSLRYEGALLWNRMPDEFKCEDFATFRNNVAKHVTLCQCGFCLLCQV